MELVPRLPSIPRGTSDDGYLQVIVDLSYAGVLLVVNAPNADAHHVSIRRRVGDAESVLVRGADPIGAPAGIAVGYDLEAPVGVACTWWAVAHAADGAVLTITDAVTLTIPAGDDGMLKSIADPAASRRIEAVSWEEAGRDSRTVLVDILNSPSQVPLLSPPGLLSGTLTLRTRSRAEYDDLVALLNSGVLLFDGPVCLGMDVPFFAVRTAELPVSRGGVGWQGKREFAVSLTEVARPVTTDTPMVSPRPGAAYADSPYAHYADVPVGLRWIDVAQGWPPSTWARGSGTGGGPVVVANPGNQTVTAGGTISLLIAASGGTGSYTWSATGLPAGMTIGRRGRVRGSTTQAGLSMVTVTATDVAGVSASASFSLTVTASSVLHLDSPGNQASTTGAAIDLQLTASGGTTPYTYAASGLPTGGTINTATGHVGGTAVTAGTYTTVFTVTDGAGATDSKTVTWTVAAVPVALQVTNPGSQSSVAGVAVSLQMAARGGTPPYTWDASGLPPGLSINTAALLVMAPEWIEV